MKYIVYNESASGKRIFQCGGCFALAVLFKSLKELGAEVYLSHRAFNVSGLPPYEEEDFMLPSPESIGTGAKAKNIDLNECITIYPEVTPENPVGSKYVVRWLLHYPGYFNEHHTTWDKENDLLFSYQGWIAEKSKELGFRIDGPLSPVHFDQEVFKDYGNPRSGTSFVKKKPPLEGSKTDKLPEGAHDISNITSNGLPSQLAEELNKYEDFYSYDENTILSLLAALCGCNSIIASQSGTKESFYEERLDCWKYGIAYGAKELDHAKNTRHLLKDAIAKEQEKGLSTVKDFMNFTHSKFN